MKAIKILTIAMAVAMNLAAMSCDTVSRIIRTGDQAETVTPVAAQPAAKSHQTIRSKQPVAKQPSAAQEVTAPAKPVEQPAVVEPVVVEQPAVVEPVAVEQPAAVESVAVEPEQPAAEVAPKKNPFDRVASAMGIKKKTDKPAKSESKPAKKDERKKKKHEPEPVPAVPAIAPSALAEMLQGEWYISSVGKDVIEREEDMPYLIFQVKEGRFYGSNGCNVINGAFGLNEAGEISFGNVLVSMRLCPDAEFESKINAAIADGRTYGLIPSSLGHESVMTLCDKSGKAVVTLRKHNMEFLNGNWRVTEIDGKSIDDEELTIFFDIAELSIHGNTGCNYFNGRIYIDPMRANAIDFSNMALTRMACPKTQQETMMMVALERTESAIDGGEGRAMLLDGNGKPVLTMVQIK